jgi:hypothetical protein
VQTSESKSGLGKNRNAEDGQMDEKPGSCTALFAPALEPPGALAASNEQLSSICQSANISSLYSEGEGQLCPVNWLWLPSLFYGSDRRLVVLGTYR